MRIAIVHDWILAWRGGEKCLEQLVEMYPQAEVFTIFSDRALIKNKLSKVKVHSSFLSKLPFVRYYYRFLLAFFPLATRDLSFKLAKIHKENNFDLVISVSHCAVKNIPLPANLRHICYCLTPVRYLWDQYENYFQNKWYEFLVRGVRGFYQRWDVRSSQGVSQFVAISQFVASRIENYYGRKSEIVYPPVELQRFLANESVAKESRDFYLMVNALVPYKMVEVAVLAFNKLEKELVVVGDGPEFDRLNALKRDNVKLLGWVNDEELEKLYGSCKALVYLALEDFGIAPVEAQASGKPVICLRKGGCAETGVFEGDEPTALEIDEITPDGVLDAIKRFESFDRTSYFKPENCRKSASRFSEPNFRENFRKVVAEC